MKLRRWTISLVGGHDEVRLRLALRVLVALLDRVLDEVEPRRRLGDPREDRHLREREVLEVLVPVAAGGRRDAVAPVAVEVLVQVLLDDHLLAGLARVGLGQADRLDDLLGLALVDAAVEGARGEEARPHELLGDRRAAAVPALDRVDRRGDEAGGIEARVLPERLVLDRGRRVDEGGRDVGERHDLAAVVAEPGELDLAAPVEDGRLLREPEVVERLLRVREVPRQERVGRHRCGGPGDAQQDEDGEQEEGDRDGRGLDRGGSVPSGAAAVVEPAPALPPEAGLHFGREDTMRGMNDRPSRSGRTMDGSGVRERDAGVTTEVGEDEASGLGGLLADLEWRGILHATTPGLPGAAGVRSTDLGVHRVRSDRRIAPRRAPRPDLRADPVPAARRPAGRPRRRGHGDDRGPVGAVVGAEPARHGDDRAQRRGHRRPARAVPGLLAGSHAGACSPTTSSGSASCR